MGGCVERGARCSAAVQESQVAAEGRSGLCGELRSLPLFTPCLYNHSPCILAAAQASVLQGHTHAIGSLWKMPVMLFDARLVTNMSLDVPLCFSSSIFWSLSLTILFPRASGGDDLAHMAGL